MTTPLSGIETVWPQLKRALAKEKKLVPAAVLGELDRIFASPPRSFEVLFGETLQGLDTPFRYAGVRLAAALCGKFKPKRLRATKLSEGENRFYPGDVIVAGNLILPATAIFVCAGDLVVEGALDGDIFDYSLAAAGKTLRARDLATCGEVIGGVAIRVARNAFFHYNDYSSLAPLLEAKVLVQADRSDVFGKVRANHRTTSDAKSAALLGLPDGDDLPERFRAAIRSANTRLVPRAPVKQPRASRAAKPIVDVCATDHLGRTALHVAAQCGADVRDLLAAGADASAVDRAGWTPLHAAIAGSGNEATVRDLIRAGADPNAKTTAPNTIYEVAAGVTPTWLAGWRCHAKVLGAILKAGGDPNTPNAHGETALFGVTRSLALIDREPLIRKLLDAGADPDHRNAKKQTFRTISKR